MTLGTVAYAAPEQLMGNPLDGRADQYALAASAFHLLTGSPPFNNANPVAVISQHLSSSPPKLAVVRPELAALDGVLARALAKDPVQRYPSCREFAQAFAGRAAKVSQSPHAATQAAFPSALAAAAPTQAAIIPNYVPPPVPATHPPLQFQPTVGVPQSERGNKTRNVALIVSIVAAVVGASVLYFVVSNKSAGTSNVRPSAPSSVAAPSSGESGTNRTDGEVGSRQDPLPIGQTVSTKDWEVTLGTPHEAWAEISAANQFNKPPEAGMQYWIVPVTATYTGDATGSPGPGIMVDFVGSDNQTYNGFNCSVVLPNSMLDIGQLYKGGVARGNKCVTIPAGMDGLWTVSTDFGTHRDLFFRPNSRKGEER